MFIIGEGLLNVARAVQGVGSALIAPSALSIVVILFAANPKELNKALALWGLFGAAGGSIGIILGGILTEFLSWRWALLIYVPIGIIILLLSYSVVLDHASLLLFQYSGRQSSKY